MLFIFVIYKLQFTFIDYIMHVFLHSRYGKTTIYGRSHQYHHKYPEQIDWLGNPPNLYVYSSNYVLDFIISLFYENTFFYPYLIYFSCHYMYYGSIYIPIVNFIPHVFESLIGHALIHKKIITNHMFISIYSDSHDIHHYINPLYNYNVGWCIIWDIIFRTRKT